MNYAEAVWQDPERMSGAVCFLCTRIPISILFDYLDEGELSEFAEGYPDVTADQVHAVLAEFPERIIEAVRKGFISRGYGGDILGLSFQQREEFYKANGITYDLDAEDMAKEGEDAKKVFGS